eukprot:XP_014002785.1 PREDICTED: splicing factor 3A subunit 2-like [Salmo salar]
MERHGSVLLEGESPKINKCSSSQLHHCPFCTYKAEQYTINNHIKGHASVRHRATIINRAPFLKHQTYYQHPEAPQEHPEALKQSPEAPQEHPEALKPSPEALKPSPEALKQSPEAPQEHPEAPQEHQEALKQSPEAPQEHPEALKEQPVASSAFHIPLNHLVPTYMESQEK